MKQILKNTSILLIFFLVFLFKESIYEIFIDVSKLDKINENIEEIKSSYYEKEYNKLLNFLNISINDDYNYIYSKIIYRDMYEYFDEITILKGSKDNINTNSAVINESGLIGTIKKVNKNSSVVNLITSSDSRVSIKVNNSYGILKYQNNKLIISSINNYEDVEIGDLVYTSGIGNLPQGIRIGKVANVEKDNLGIEKTIIVEANVDFNDISYVAILNGEEQ